MRVSLVVAAAENDVIGHAGDLPWHLPEDLRRFKRLTDGHCVVAGRRTHESIVDRLGQPLPGRTTVVATRRGRWDDGRVRYRDSVAAALAEAGVVAAFNRQEEVFVIGGAQVYAAALPSVSRVYLTRVHQVVAGDARMPEGWLSPFALVGDEPATTGGYTFQTYDRR